MTPFQHLAWVCCPRSSRLKLLAMFTAYFDESGHPSDSRVITVACVVAKARQWNQFNDKWAKRLRRAKVTMFHMTDFESRHGEFAGWEEQKRTAFIVDLAAVLTNTIECGVSGSVLMKDWIAIMPHRFVEQEFVARRGAYSLLFQICLEKIAQLLHVPTSETVACVFDENNFMRGAIAEHYRDWKKEQNLESVFGSLIFANKRQVLPLQAADIVAYESYKHVMNVIQLNPREERKLHANLWRSKRLHSFGLTQDGLRSYLRKLEEMDAELKSQSPLNNTS